MLVDQHTAANKELVELANTKKVELPAAPARGMRVEVEKLAKLNGKEFDQRFMREVGIKDHEQDIKKFQAASGKVQDPELKAWIQKTLPTLREHLAHAQKLQGGDAAAMGNRGPAGKRAMTEKPGG
jgi:putative membrane protein